MPTHEYRPKDNKRIIKQHCEQRYAYLFGDLEEMDDSLERYELKIDKK